MVAARRTRHDRRAHRRHERRQVARAALEGIAWRVADIVAAVRESVAVDTLRVDGGLTNEPALLQLQADAIGAPVEHGLADATAAGAAALAAVGAGLPTTSPRSRTSSRPPGRVEPQRDDAWRASEHEAWRQFVQLAVEL